MTVGEKLRMLRGERSMQEVADATGILQSSLSHYETNRQVPNDDKKKILANYYGKPVGWIFFDEE